MRRTAAALAATVAGLIALLTFKSHAAQTTAADAPQAPAGAVQSATANPAPTTGASAAATASATASGSAPAPAAAGTTAAGSAGKSGSFTGTAADTIFGPVQVRATVAGGKLTAVTVLQVPDRGGYEQNIVATDVPQLTSEALSAQSAHIESVSGATYTSQGYMQSLQSALDQAGL
jgi:uncharacterized protein with FMN-binding domain